MITVIDSSRAEMLSEVRAKREMALRCARTGDLREQEYWLRIAGRMTEWIEHLEEQDGMHTVTVPCNRGLADGRSELDLPRGARSRGKPVLEKVGAL